MSRTPPSRRSLAGTHPHTRNLMPMNQQAVSEIYFEETYCVPAEQTARSLFARLPHGRDYAQTLIECLATSYLVAVVESICILLGGDASARDH